MALATAMILGVLTAGGPTPLERSRANYEAIRAAVQFRFAYDRPTGSGVEDPATVVLGTWSCDGRAEHLLWCLKAGTPKPLADEVLWNGATLVTRRPRSLEVAEGDGVAPPRDARSPLWWGMATSFPHMIDSTFEGVAPSLQPGARGGRPVQVESYCKTGEGGWTRVEIAYDPSIGWLPRTVRMVEFDRGTGAVAGLSVEIRQAWRCASGGYVPTEWTCETWEIDGLAVGYEESPQGVPTGDRRTTAHLRATEVHDLSTAPAIITAGAVDTIEGPGGAVALALDIPPVTIDEARRILGPKVIAPSPSTVATDAPKPDAPAVLLALATTGLIARVAVRTVTRWLQ